MSEDDLEFLVVEDQSLVDLLGQLPYELFRLPLGFQDPRKYLRILVGLLVHATEPLEVPLPRGWRLG